MTFASSSTWRLAGLAALALSVFTGCPPEGGEPDAGVGQVCTTAEPSERVCDADRNCGGGFCNFEDDGDDVSRDDGDTQGCCEFLNCINDESCGPGKICDVRRGICIAENFCDPNDPAACDGDDRCIFRDGTPICEATPDVAACSIAPSPAIANAGDAVQLEAVGKNAEGALVPHAEFTWSATGATVDAATGQVTAECAGPAVCEITATATATKGGGTCNGTIRVYPNIEAGEARLVLIDTVTRTPIVGAQVAVRVGGALETANTDADGAAVFEVAGPVQAISAFPADHQWNSIIDPPNDVIVFTSPLPAVGQVAGAKGRFDFTRTTTSGDIKLGLAGTGISANITDLNFATLIGEIADTEVVVDGLTNPGDTFPLPSGLVLELGADPIKPDYIAFAEEGEGFAWALGGTLNISELTDIIPSVTGGDDVNVGAILGAALPFFSKFDHAFVSGLDFALIDAPTPAADNDGNGFPDSAQPLSAYPGFEEVTLTPNTLLGLSADYTVPNLPCAPGGGAQPACVSPGNDAETGEPLAPWASGAVLLTGVNVPGLGLVPLGLTAGLDNYDDESDALVDGQLDSETAGVGKGEALLDYAPPHDGLEGNLLFTIAIALDINSLSSDALSASIITRIARNFGATNAFENDFLEHQGGAFTAGAAGTFTHEAVGTADFYRANLDDGGDVEWNVWFQDAGTTFNVADLHPTPAQAAERAVAADIQAFGMGTGYDGLVAADFGSLFGFNGTNLDNLLYYLGAWSSQPCAADGVCDLN